MSFYKLSVLAAILTLIPSTGFTKAPYPADAQELSVALVAAEDNVAFSGELSTFWTIFNGAAKYTHWLNETTENTAVAYVGLGWMQAFQVQLGKGSDDIEYLRIKTVVPLNLNYMRPSSFGWVGYCETAINGQKNDSTSCAAGASIRF